VTYAKAAPDDICIVIEATNHGPDTAPLHVLPQVWFRNTWRWGRDDRQARLERFDPPSQRSANARAVRSRHDYLGEYFLSAEGVPEVLVCDNETDAVALWGAANNPTPYPKDGIHRRVVEGQRDAVNPAGSGTKAAFWYEFDPARRVRIRRSRAGETVRLRLR